MTTRHRLAIYLKPTELDDLRDAFYADWVVGGDAASIGAWVTDAIRAHAALTPQQRAALNLPARPDARGASYPIAIAIDALHAMRAAITDDIAHGSHWSESAWSARAVAAAVNQTRTSHGGSLPPSPPLPRGPLRRYHPPAGT